MLHIRQILVTALVPALGAATLAGCGQRGPLYLPQDPAAANRATLPDTLSPYGTQRAVPASAPAANPAAAAPTAPSSRPTETHPPALP